MENKRATPSGKGRQKGGAWAAARFFCFRIFPCLMGVLLGALDAVAGPSLQVPPGFQVGQVISEPLVRFPMFATLDPERRLFVTESSGNDLYAELDHLVRKCRVSLLDGRKKDGGYERCTVFADKLAPCMGLAWHEGKLYLADPPDLVALEDPAHTGRATKRTVILSGFGHTDNGSLHGLTFGPDGWLYFTTGNPDGYDLRGPDGSHAKGQVGALLRCLPDGSRVETVSRGFENLVEIVFLPDGSIIGTDTWYQLPDRGVRDALVHLLEEGQYPIHPIDPTVSHLQFNRVLPPVALFPAVAHSGLVRYKGQAFPADMRGDLFSAQHNTRKIVRHKLKAAGSSYSAETFDFVTTDDPDVHFSDVLEDQDGSLLIVDTGSWYVQHCPTGRIRQAPAQGGIYRVSFTQAGEPQPRENTPNDQNWMVEVESTNHIRAALAARMLGRAGTKSAAPALSKLLRSEDPPLRLAAAEAVAHCGNANSVPQVLAALALSSDEFLEHALTYALYRLGDTTALMRALEMPSPKVQSAALLLLDQSPFEGATAPMVAARLTSPDAQLRDTALWVLLRHSDWGHEGATLLRQLLASKTFQEADRIALGRLLPVFSKNVTVLAEVANALAASNDSIATAARVGLLNTVSALELESVPVGWKEAILQLVEANDPAVRSAAIRATAALRIPDAEQALKKVVFDPAALSEMRLEAARELVHRQPSLSNEEMAFLLSQFSAAAPASAHLAAVEIIENGKPSASQIAALIDAVRGDVLVSPAGIVRIAEKDGFRPSYAVKLVRYIAESLESGWTLSAEQLNKVEAAVPANESNEAKTLLVRVSESAERQLRQLAQFEPFLRGGDAGRGEKLFFEKAQCINCHRIWENGGRVGPDLSRVGAIRSGRDLLESILVPSSTIAQGYETLNVFTRDGESYSGVRIGREDEPLRLRLASGSEILLHHDQVQRIDHSKVSLMPEGLLNTLTSQETRDLLAFLQHLK
jgi:putative membrane-bound dehydrogenase-like protein